jgi:hypothetical protein
MPEKEGSAQLGSSISTRKAQSRDDTRKNLLRRTLRWLSVVVLVFPRGATVPITGSKLI